jgi:hypothetical protein
MQAKISAIWTLIKTQLADIWAKSKIYIIAGASLLIYLKWRQIKEYMIVKAGNKEIQQSNVQDKELSTAETTANASADALVKAAETLPASEPAISDDWFIKK